MTEHERNLTAAVAGDDAALARLMREYHGRVYRFGLRVCRDGFDADDAVQEAFVKLASRPDVAREGGALSWLMTVVRRACLRMLRPFSRDRRTLGERLDNADEVPSDEPSPEDALERFRLVRIVHQAIAGLSRPLREVLIMRDIEGLSGADACKALGLSEATMKTRLHRARHELRGAIAPALDANGEPAPWN
jgi:RNA polymerase sigma-70 factor (ECF subfamily)